MTNSISFPELLSLAYKDGRHIDYLGLKVQQIQRLHEVALKAYPDYKGVDIKQQVEMLSACYFELTEKRIADDDPKN